MIFMPITLQQVNVRDRLFRPEYVRDQSETTAPCVWRDDQVAVIEASAEAYVNDSEQGTNS